MERLGSNRMNFDVIGYLRIVLNSAKKIQVSLISEKKNGYFTLRAIYIFDHVSKHFSKIVPLINVEKYCRPGQATDRKYGACALNSEYLGLQNTLSEYVTLTAFPL
jgi:hypothetical protein